MFSTNYLVWTSILDIVNHPHQLGKSGNRTEIQGSRCQLGTKFQEGLSKNSRLRPALLNFSCTTKHQKPMSTNRLGGLNHGEENQSSWWFGSGHVTPYSYAYQVFHNKNYVIFWFNIYLTSWNLGWPCEFLWPRDCSRSDTVRIPEPRTQEALQFLLHHCELSWNHHI